jgi:branched-subunit amino acid aminotransferase/4-amino-4-deoxychorismate lyase
MNPQRSGAVDQKEGLFIGGTLRKLFPIGKISLQGIHKIMGAGASCVHSRQAPIIKHLF